MDKKCWISAKYFLMFADKLIILGTNCLGVAYPLVLAAAFCITNRVNFITEMYEKKSLSCLKF